MMTRPDDDSPSWQDWPQGLSGRADQIVAEVRAGHPVEALDLLDALISDLTARRETLAEVANRRFEPSTDDRQV